MKRGICLRASWLATAHEGRSLATGFATARDDRLADVQPVSQNPRFNPTVSATLFVVLPFRSNEVASLKSNLPR